jgi:hypothetical protein
MLILIAVAIKVAKLLVIIKSGGKPVIILK